MVRRMLGVGCPTVATNTEIDEIKVIQNHYEAFIHRSFHA